MQTLQSLIADGHSPESAHAQLTATPVGRLIRAIEATKSRAELEEVLERVDTAEREGFTREERKAIFSAIDGRRGAFVPPPEPEPEIEEVSSTMPPPPRALELELEPDEAAVAHGLSVVTGTHEDDND